ncbi:hypothetical protein DFJ73DRAFT_85180 [Zopfochytrium polystomum]|nr:hypothetical protein DFJ73DRAFT_85180 [Zopfochytrium polystomum]
MDHSSRDAGVAFPINNNQTSLSRTADCLYPQPHAGPLADPNPFGQPLPTTALGIHSSHPGNAMEIIWPQTPSGTDSNGVATVWPATPYDEVSGASEHERNAAAAAGTHSISRVGAAGTLFAKSPPSSSSIFPASPHGGFYHHQLQQQLHHHNHLHQHNHHHEQHRQPRPEHHDAFRPFSSSASASSFADCSFGSKNPPAEAAFDSLGKFRRFSDELRALGTEESGCRLQPSAAHQAPAAEPLNRWSIGTAPRLMQEQGHFHGTGFRNGPHRPLKVDADILLKLVDGPELPPSLEGFSNFATVFIFTAYQFHPSLKRFSFDSSAEMPDFLSWFESILQATELSRTIVIVALHFLQRFFQLNYLAGERLFLKKVSLLSLMLSNKIVDDQLSKTDLFLQVER